MWFVCKSKILLAARLLLSPSLFFMFLTLAEVTRDYIPGLFLALLMSFSSRYFLIRRLSVTLLSTSLFFAAILSFVSRISAVSTGFFDYISNLNMHILVLAFRDSLFYLSGFNVLNTCQQLFIPSDNLHSWVDTFLNIQPLNPSLFGIYSPLSQPLFDTYRPYSAFVHWFELSPLLPLLFCFVVSFASSSAVLRSRNSFLLVILLCLNILFLISLFQYYPRQCLRFFQLAILLSFLAMRPLRIKTPFLRK